jgi:putative ABC transport system permease protein
MLTVLSVGFSLALMTLLYGYLAMQNVWGKAAEKYNRIVVMNVQGFAGAVPIAYVDRITRMKGIKAAVPYSWFGGVYKDERMPFAQFATYPDAAFKVWDELKIAPEQLASQLGRAIAGAASRTESLRNAAAGRSASRFR